MRRVSDERPALHTKIENSPVVCEKLVRLPFCMRRHDLQLQRMVLQ
jgi:hypothetical protein